MSTLSLQPSRPSRLSGLGRLVVGVLAAAGLSGLGAPADAQGPVYLNEIFFNPGGNGQDARDEYIEIRGDANQSLADHYIIVVEAENSGQQGEIENIFDLGDFSLGSNGFLVLRQAFNIYGSTSPINPAATDLVNEGPLLGPTTLPGFGSGDNSTIGASDLPSDPTGLPEGQLEGSGFSAFLIRNDSGEAPELGQDIDEGDDGLDVPTVAEGWTVLDSIGFITEFDEISGGGRLYAQTNFFIADIFTPEEDLLREPGSEFATVGYEIEYLARWGNSTGTSPDDWHASNLTDNEGSGSLGVVNRPGTEDDQIDWRQSLIGDHPADDENPNTPAPSQPAVESNQNVPYGTRLTDTIGGPNYITGDFNRDGVVDIADYTVWRDTLGTRPDDLSTPDIIEGDASENNQPAADHNHDFVVDIQDYFLWRDNFGAPFNTGSPIPATLAITTPEPGAAVLLLTVLGAAACRRR